MAILQQIAAAMAAPDANLDELSTLQQQVLQSIRKPYDSASPGSPAAAAGSAMPMSNGAAAPDPNQPAPGQVSPMLAALMSQGGGGGMSPGGPVPVAPTPAPGFPVRGVSASPAPPNMDEVRRMLTTAGSRNQ